MAHLQGSLASLVDDLRNGGHSFPILRQGSFMNKFQSKEEADAALALITQKSFYPYEYFEGIDQLGSQTCIPSRDKFYSKISQTTISEKDWLHAKKVFRTFKCKTMLCYTKLYVESDTLLLSEVFLKYCKVMQKEFHLDPSHFLGIPSFSFNCMLYLTKVKLDRLTCPQMSAFFRRGIRGGMSVVVTRYAEGTPGIEKTEEEENKIIYVDGESTLSFFSFFQKKLHPHCLTFFHALTFQQTVCMDQQ